MDIIYGPLSTSFKTTRDNVLTESIALEKSRVDIETPVESLPYQAHYRVALKDAAEQRDTVQWFQLFVHLHQWLGPFVRLMVMMMVATQPIKKYIHNQQSDVHITVTLLWPVLFLVVDLVYTGLYTQRESILRALENDPSIRTSVCKETRVFSVGSYFTADPFVLGVAMGTPKFLIPLAQLILLGMHYRKDAFALYFLVWTLVMFEAIVSFVVEFLHSGFLHTSSYFPERLSNQLTFLHHCLQNPWIIPVEGEDTFYIPSLKQRVEHLLVMVARLRQNDAKLTNSQRLVVTAARVQSFRRLLEEARTLGDVPTEMRILHIYDAYQQEERTV